MSRLEKSRDKRAAEKLFYDKRVDEKGAADDFVASAKEYARGKAPRSIVLVALEGLDNARAETVAAKEAFEAFKVKRAKKEPTDETPAKK